MFSGIITDSGIVQEVTSQNGGGSRLRVRTQDASDQEIEAKDSVALNGVCLTVTNADHNVLEFDVVPETLRRSNLAAVKAGERVNIEYALRLGERIGGHLVYGHVDTTARVLSKNPEGNGQRMRIELPEPLRECIVDKAFVAIDGVSLTVAAAGEGWFEIALVPETLKRTTFGTRQEGDLVNIEVDPIARYVALSRSSSAPFDDASHRSGSFDTSG